MVNNNFDRLSPTDVHCGITDTFRRGFCAGLIPMHSFSVISSDFQTTRISHWFYKFSELRSVARGATVRSIYAECCVYADSWAEPLADCMHVFLCMDTTAKLWAQHRLIYSLLQNSQFKIARAEWGELS